MLCNWLDCRRIVYISSIDSTYYCLVPSLLFTQDEILASFSSRHRLTHFCCVFFANQWRTLSNKSQKLELSILIKFFKPIRSSSSNSLIRAWYAPQHHLRSSDTHVLTQQGILLFVFLFFIPVAKMILEAVMMRVRFCNLDMFSSLFC